MLDQLEVTAVIGQVLLQRHCNCHDNLPFNEPPLMAKASR
jgi:hypothetical protein